MRKIILFLFLSVVLNLITVNAFSQCGTCAATDYASIDVCGWTVGQTGTITTAQYGGERSTIYNTVNGAVYLVSTCGASYDTQLSIFTTGCTFVSGGYNDDNGPGCGGTAASVQFTSPGGNLYAKMNKYNCTTQSTNVTVTIKLISLPSCGLAQGTVTNAGPINFCNAGGDWSAVPIQVNGSSGGTVTWQYGWSSGGWSGDWVTGTSPGYCCFPPKVNSSDGNADRIRWYVKNCCGVTSYSAPILLQNRYNAAPTSLSRTGGGTVCQGTSITLTANFAANINILGTVKFATSCGGSPFASVTAGNNVNSVSTSVTPPVGTTTYYAWYDPGSGTSCSATSCATSSSVTVVPTPAGTLSANAYCTAGSGSTAQLVWTASNGSPNYTINYTASATSNAVGYTGSFTGTAAIGTAQTFNVPWQPIESTTYTVTSITDGYGCPASSLPAPVITVTDVAPSYSATAATPSGAGTAYTPAYPVSGTTPPGWGISGGQTITYSNSSWPLCTNWGISIPTLNASAPTSNPLDLDITDGTNTNFTSGKLRFTGSTTYYYMSGGSMVSNPLNTRCTITSSRPIQYLPSAGYFAVKPVQGTSTNLVINILFETQVPSPAPQFGGYTAGSWIPSVEFYNNIHAPSAGSGSVIYSGFTNGFRFFSISPSSVIGASISNNPVCINYSAGGVPTGGPVNAAGNLGSLNTACTFTHLWTSSAPSLINTGNQNPTPIVSNATSSSLTTYTYTVSSASDRVCYGTATTATVTANTTSPTTWNGTGATTNTAGNDNWYIHTNWSNCVPCNTSPSACNKQAVIGNAPNQPIVNTPGAKATSVIVNNAGTNKVTLTPSCITTATPSNPGLKLIIP